MLRIAGLRVLAVAQCVQLLALPGAVAPPEIEVLDAQTMKVSWPASAGAVVLQECVTPGQAGPWQDVSVPPTLAAGFYSVTRILPGNYVRWFFRLRGVEWDSVSYRLHGLNSSPYVNPDENPDLNLPGQITPEELWARLRAVAPLTQWLRTFGVTGDLKPAGGMAHALGLKTAIGAWLGRDEAENRKQVEALVELALQGDVDVAVVGSEVLLRGDLSEARLLEYIGEVKTRLETAGLSIPVTYGDVYGVYLDHPGLIAAVDFLFVNYYPYWEGRGVDCAVAYLDRSHEALKLAAGGKTVIVSETGWPNCGERKGDAVPSPENAAEYFLTFVSWARAKEVAYFYFAAFDEPWKTVHEGPQGACWGILTSAGAVKPGNERVFAGETTEDRWSSCPSRIPIVDFFTQPDSRTSNLRHCLVAGSTSPGNRVFVNGTELGPGKLDDAGSFAEVVVLAEGPNAVDVTVHSADGVTVVRQATKMINYDPAHSTAGLRLVYVDVVPGDGPITAVNGTVVVDVDGFAILGVLPDRHVRGISPDAAEVYVDDRSVVSTSTHQTLRTLPFTSDLPLNGFLVSPDGQRLYAYNEVVDVAGNERVSPSLPVSILTGGAWGGAAVPGGPAISADGRFIFCQNAVLRIATDTGEAVSTDMSGHFMSDIALAPEADRILVSEYSFASGRIKIHDASTYGLETTVGGLPDFTGEIRVLGNRAVAGAAGNPAMLFGGRLQAIDVVSGVVLSSVVAPLADNLAVSDRGEIFASAGLPDEVQGHRFGLDVWALTPTGELERNRTFFFGVNRFVVAVGRPSYDQIRRIVFKAAVAAPEAGSLGNFRSVPKSNRAVSSRLAPGNRKARVE